LLNDLLHVVSYFQLAYYKLEKPFVNFDLQINKNFGIIQSQQNKLPTVCEKQVN